MTTNEEFKCRICKLDENWQQKEEEENESSSPPSLSNVSNANTVSNEQQTSASLGGKTVEECIKSRGVNPKWSNKLLMKAMGIEEETPSDTAGTREEEDISPSLSSLSNANTNTVLDKDNRMIRLFESITINDGPNSDNARSRKDDLFRLMNNFEDHFVLSDNQHAFDQLIQQRLNDENLFKTSFFTSNCLICNMKLPHYSSGKVYLMCCGKVICNLCDHELRKENPAFCLLCDTPMPDSDEEIIKRQIKRIVLDHVYGVAINGLGCFYQSRMFGLPQSYSNALNLYYWAASNGSGDAFCNIADAYDNGRGVRRDYEKAWHYYQLAAMGGNVNARYNLGVTEMLVGNTERALKHFMIAIRYGCVDSLNKVKLIYRDGYATKEDYTNALQYYQAYDGCNRDREDKAREAVGALAGKPPLGVEEEDIMALAPQESEEECPMLVDLGTFEHRQIAPQPRQVQEKLPNGAYEEKSETDQPIIEAATPQLINGERRPTRAEEEFIQLFINQTGGSRAEVVKFLTDKGAFEPRQPAPQYIQEELPDGVKEKDIELVISQASCSRRQAIKALAENDCDCIDAIFSLTT